jgi:methyl-accepting chemotaxis protein
MKLNIQGKLLALSLVGLAFVTIVGGVGYAASMRIAGVAADISDSGSALKSQLQADQAHDALRGDVLSALLAGGKKDAEHEKAIKAELEQHSKLFHESIAKLQAQPLDDATRQAVRQVEPALAAYVDIASKVVTLAFADRNAADTSMGEFTTAFKRVEKEMEALSELIVERAKSAEAAGTSSAAAAKTIILAAIGVSAVVMLCIAWLTSRSIVLPIRHAVLIAEKVASGDLRSNIEVKGHDETAQLLASLKRMNDNLATVVGTVRTGSDNIATGSSQISTGNYDLSQRTEEQASNLQQAAASMEQITATVRSNADTAREASRLAGIASEAATQGGRAVEQVANTMTEIATSSRRINDIVGVIDGIAFQTNILALNAAVEAARAGEQGRGFSVVAAEVRTLAQRCAVAAKEIKGLIQASVEKVNAGSRQAGDAGRTVDGIVAQVHRVTQLIGEISQATQEQTSGIEQVSDAVGQLDQVTQQNAALVEEAAAAAESLKTQAGRLVDAVAVFKMA